MGSNGEEPRWRETGGKQLEEKFTYYSDGPAGDCPLRATPPRCCAIPWIRLRGGGGEGSKFEYIADGSPDEKGATRARKSHYLNSHKPAISKESLQELRNAPRLTKEDLPLGPSSRMSMKAGGKYDKKLEPLSINQGPYEDPKVGGEGRSGGGFGRATVAHNLRPLNSLRSPRNLPGSRRPTLGDDQEAEGNWKSLGLRDSLFNPTRVQTLPPLNASEKDPKGHNPDHPEWNSSTHANIWDTAIGPHHVGARQSKLQLQDSDENGKPVWKVGGTLETPQGSDETPGRGKGEKKKKKQSHIEHGSAKGKGPWRQGRPRARSFGSYLDDEGGSRTTLDEDLASALANDAANLEIHGRHNNRVNLQHAHDQSLASHVD
ncbi:hypothetical protein CYMTET_34253, partial [Cymbomonas tetramitiformis]